MKKVLGFVFVFFLILFLSSTPFIYCYFVLPIRIVNFSYSELLEDDSKDMTVKIQNDILNPVCSIDGVNWIHASNGECKFNVNTGNYKVVVKNRLTEDIKKITVTINDVKSVEMNTPKYYLAIDEEYQLRANVTTAGENGDKTLKWSTSDDSIVTVNDGLIHGLKEGTATIKAESINGIVAETNVIVTDIIMKPTYNPKKPFLPCGKYSQDEAHLLDDILATRIAAEGKGSRAALIQTIRFMTLSFRYRIPYFFEHGRLNNTSGQRYVDGEGRYYHIGLYLSEDKYKDLKAIHCRKPQMWGCGLPNYDDTYGWKTNVNYPNGLDCSGFVSWSLLNSGHDIGDIGSGFNDNPKAPDLSDLGEMHTLTYDYANNGDYKVGDIIGINGHIALIAAMDDTYIYVAESLNHGVWLNKVSKKQSGGTLYKEYTYINRLDDFYTEDGTYTNMW